MKKVSLWKNLILIASLIVIVIIATFAWFFTGPRGTMEDLVVHIGRATYIQVSDGESGFWTEDLSVPITLVKRFKEVSGNGTTLYSPVYDDVKTGVNGGYRRDLVSFTIADVDSYFEHTLDFRSDVVQDIYLSPESYAKVWEAKDGHKINGAVRVAFFEVDQKGNETLSYVWAPNSRVEYSADTESFIEEGSVEPYYYYQKSTNFENTATLRGSTSNVTMISTANTDENGCGYDETNRYLWSNGEYLPEDAPAVLTVDEKHDDGLYYKKIKVRVWIEGHDRECVSLLSGEKFIVKLEFEKPRGDAT